MSNPNDIAKKTRESQKRSEPFFSEAHAAIYASVAAGEDKTVIVRRFNINRSTVYDTIDRYSKRNDFKSRPRVGHPRLLNTREEYYLVRLARRLSNASWRTLLQLSGSRASEMTARSILRRHHIYKRRSRRRSKLTSLHAKKRCAFCQFWMGREVEPALDNP